MIVWKDPVAAAIPEFLRSEHPLVARTLVRRGFTTAETARAFLDPSACPPAPARDLPGMDRAIERLARAIRDHESILVWGDFDVDGQTATTVLVGTLKDFGADVHYHIPIRAKESHGIRPEVLADLLDRETRLVLTCDTGITAHAAVEVAKARGVEMIITDHHDLPEELPPALAVINPKLLAPEHPLAALPGVGVAYKLAEALYAHFGRAGDEEQHLDLVALGIVADLAMLSGETRCLLQRGLRVLREGRRTGLRLLCESARIDPARLNESQIGFTLGPRLNALGRLADANPAVSLFTAQDKVYLQSIIGQIESLNAQRRLLTAQVYAAAEAQLKADPALLESPALVMSHPAWPGGVVGIVANKLADRYQRPVVLLTSPPGEAARGSARSVEGVNITEAIAAQADLLHGFGGHPMAAGLSLDPERVDEFRRRLGKAVQAQLGAAAREEPALEIDAWVSLPELNFDLAAQIERLSPFGPGNPALTLAARGLTLQKKSAIGRGDEHLKLQVADAKGGRQDVLWWDGASEPLAEDLSDGARFDLAFHLRLSDYRGRPQLSVEFIDARLSAEQPVAVKAERIAVVDWRAETDPLPLIRSLPADAQVWAEGGHKKSLGGRARHELARAERLVIYTAPPGPRELRAALQAARPKTVYLICLPPDDGDTEDFLTELAGLAKFAINRRDGKAELSALADACAQREITVQIGLYWLAAIGALQADIESGVARLARGDGTRQVETQRELYSALETLRAESAAFRAHLRRAPAEGWLRI